MQTFMHKKETVERKWYVIEMVEKYPEEMVERAVKGMLPHGRLGRAMGKKLFVYANAEHEHMAQKPEKISVR